jgi:putative transposase
VEGRVLELASKAGRKELDQEWKVLRRGWYVGDNRFREKLGSYVEKALQGRRPQSHSGEARVGHDEAAAERGLRQALAALGLDERVLKVLPKGAAEKAVLAWWVRGRTTVSLRWVGERLRMGHLSRVCQAVGQVRQKPTSKQRRRLRQLRHLEQETQS